MVNKRKEHFDLSAESYYCNYARENSLGRGVRKKYLDIILPVVKDKRTLEIGCGPGTFIVEVSRLNNMTVGIDFSENMLRIAKNKNRFKNLLQADATSLPFKNESFEVVYIIRTLQHIPDYTLALSEINRVLLPRGIVLFDIINVMNPFGFIRSILFRPFESVYLRSDSHRGIYRICRNVKIEILQVYPIQLFIDLSNLNKYLPSFVSKFVSKIFNYLENKLSQASFYRRFALRLLFVGRKK